MLGRVTVVLLAVLLVWGNLVAGLKAGLACPDWPLCHGRVLPPFRIDIYMEFLHRVIAAVSAGFLAVLSYRRFRSYRGAARAVPVAAVTLVAAVIVMGGFVVLLGLPAQLTTVHFLAALVVFLLAVYMAEFDGEEKKPPLPAGGVPALLASLGALVLFQAALGAYVRHSHAGLSCPDFPTCLGGWLPPVMDGMVLAHFSHRVAAVLVLFSILVFFAASRLDERLKASRHGAALLLVLVAAQIAVGALVVVSGLYFVATALHLAVALAMLYVIAGMWSGAAVLEEGA